MTKNIVIGVLGVLTLFFGSSFFGGHPLGTANPTGPQHYSMESFLQGLVIGQRGTPVSVLLDKSCSLIAPSYSVAASTTVSMDCALTGAVSGDIVFASFATSSALYNGWEITGASASSTPGYDTFRVYNGLGATSIIPASVASSTNVLNLR